MNEEWVMTEQEQKDWDTAFEDLAAYEKEIENEKDRYYHELKHLVNVRCVWKWLNYDMRWQVVGVFTPQIFDKLSGYYNKIMPHATFDCEELKYVEMNRQTEEKRGTGINHVFINQLSTGMEGDSFSGYLAIPLRNFKYFVISYEC